MKKHALSVAENPPSVGKIVIDCLHLKESYFNLLSGNFPNERNKVKQGLSLATQWQGHLRFCYKPGYLNLTDLYANSKSLV